MFVKCDSSIRLYKSNQASQVHFSMSNCMLEDTNHMNEESVQDQIAHLIVLLKQLFSLSQFIE